MWGIHLHSEYDDEFVVLRYGDEFFATTLGDQVAWTKSRSQARQLRPEEVRFYQKRIAEVDSLFRTKVVTKPHPEQEKRPRSGLLSRMWNVAESVFLYACLSLIVWRVSRNEKARS